MKYVLAIHAPDSKSATLMQLRSSEPFGAVTRGEYIDPNTQREAEAFADGRWLLVTNVVHRIRQEGEVITHWTDVYSVYVEEPNEADLKALR